MSVALQTLRDGIVADPLADDDEASNSTSSSDEGVGSPLRAGDPAAGDEAVGAAAAVDSCPSGPWPLRLRRGQLYVARRALEEAFPEASRQLVKDGISPAVQVYGVCSSGRLRLFGGVRLIQYQRNCCLSAIAAIVRYVQQGSRSGAQVEKGTLQLTLLANGAGAVISAVGACLLQQEAQLRCMPTAEQAAPAAPAAVGPGPGHAATAGTASLPAARPDSAGAESASDGSDEDVPLASRRALRSTAAALDEGSGGHVDGSGGGSGIGGGGGMKGGVGVGSGSGSGGDLSFFFLKLSSSQLHVPVALVRHPFWAVHNTGTAGSRPVRLFIRRGGSGGGSSISQVSSGSGVAAPRAYTCVLAAYNHSAKSPSLMYRMNGAAELVRDLGMSNARGSWVRLIPQSDGSGLVDAAPQGEREVCLLQARQRRPLQARQRVPQHKQQQMEVGVISRGGGVRVPAGKPTEDGTSSGGGSSGDDDDDDDDEYDSGGGDSSGSEGPSGSEGGGAGAAGPRAHVPMQQRRTTWAPAAAKAELAGTEAGPSLVAAKAQLPRVAFGTAAAPAVVSSTSPATVTTEARTGRLGLPSSVGAAVLPPSAAARAPASAAATSDPAEGRVALAPVGAWADSGAPLPGAAAAGDGSDDDMPLASRRARLATAAAPARDGAAHVRGGGSATDAPNSGNGSGDCSFSVKLINGQLYLPVGLIRHRFWAVYNTGAAGSLPVQLYTCRGGTRSTQHCSGVVEAAKQAHNCTLSTYVYKTSRQVCWRITGVSSMMTELGMSVRLGGSVRLTPQPDGSGLVEAAPEGEQESWQQRQGQPRARVGGVRPGRGVGMAVGLPSGLGGGGGSKYSDDTGEDAEDDDDSSGGGTDDSGWDDGGSKRSGDGRRGEGDEASSSGADSSDDSDDCSGDDGVGAPHMRSSRRHSYSTGHLRLSEPYIYGHQTLLDCFPGAFSGGGLSSDPTVALDFGSRGRYSAKVVMYGKGNHYRISCIRDLVRGLGLVDGTMLSVAPVGDTAGVGGGRTATAQVNQDGSAGCGARHKRRRQEEGPPRKEQPLLHGGNGGGGGGDGSDNGASAAAVAVAVGAAPICGSDKGNVPLQKRHVDSWRPVGPSTLAPWDGSSGCGSGEAVAIKCKPLSGPVGSGPAAAGSLLGKRPAGGPDGGSSAGSGGGGGLSLGSKILPAAAGPAMVIPSTAQAPPAAAPPPWWSADVSAAAGAPVNVTPQLAPPAAGMLPPVAPAAHLLSYLPPCVDPLPPLQPGELRLCGLTFHPDLAHSARVAMADWIAGLGCPLARADVTKVQLAGVGRNGSTLVAAAPGTAGGASAGGAAAAGVSSGQQQQSAAAAPWEAVFVGRGLSRNIVYTRLAQLLRLSGEDGSTDARLPEGRVLMKSALRVVDIGAEDARGGAGTTLVLEASAPVRRNAALGVVGGYVLPRAAAEELVASAAVTRWHCRPETMSLKAAGTSAYPGVAWRRMVRSCLLPYPAKLATAEAGAGGTGGTEEPLMLVHSDWAALLSAVDSLPSTPPAQPANSNCMILPVCVRGLVLPVLVAVRDIAPGERLLLDMEAAWWQPQAAAEEEHQRPLPATGATTALEASMAAAGTAAQWPRSAAAVPAVPVSANEVLPQGPAAPQGLHRAAERSATAFPAPPVRSPPPPLQLPPSLPSPQWQAALPGTANHPWAIAESSNALRRASSAGGGRRNQEGVRRGSGSSLEPDISLPLPPARLPRPPPRPVPPPPQPSKEGGIARTGSGAARGGSSGVALPSGVRVRERSATWGGAGSLPPPRSRSRGGGGGRDARRWRDTMRRSRSPDRSLSRHDAAAKHSERGRTRSPGRRPAAPEGHGDRGSRRKHRSRSSSRSRGRSRGKDGDRERERRRHHSNSRGRHPLERWRSHSRDRSRDQGHRECGRPAADDPRVPWTGPEPMSKRGSCKAGGATVFAPGQGNEAAPLTARQPMPAPVPDSGPPQQPYAGPGATSPAGTPSRLRGGWSRGGRMPRRGEARWGAPTATEGLTVASVFGQGEGPGAAGANAAASLAQVSGGAALKQKTGGGPETPAPAPSITLAARAAPCGPPVAPQVLLVIKPNRPQLRAAMKLQQQPAAVAAAAAQTEGSAVGDSGGDVAAARIASRNGAVDGNGTAGNSSATALPPVLQPQPPQPAAVLRHQLPLQPARTSATQAELPWPVVSKHRGSESELHVELDKAAGRGALSGLLTALGAELGLKDVIREIQQGKLDYLGLAAVVGAQQLVEVGALPYVQGAVLRVTCCPVPGLKLRLSHRNRTSTFTPTWSDLRVTAHFGELLDNMAAADQASRRAMTLWLNSLNAFAPSVRLKLDPASVRGQGGAAGSGAVAAVQAQVVGVPLSEAAGPLFVQDRIHERPVPLEESPTSPPLSAVAQQAAAIPTHAPAPGVRHPPLPHPQHAAVYVHAPSYPTAATAAAAAAAQLQHQHYYHARHYQHPVPWGWGAQRQQAYVYPAQQHLPQPQQCRYYSNYYAQGPPATPPPGAASAEQEVAGAGTWSPMDYQQQQQQQAQPTPQQQLHLQQPTPQDQEPLQYMSQKGQLEEQAQQPQAQTQQQQQSHAQQTQEQTTQDGQTQEGCSVEICRQGLSTEQTYALGFSPAAGGGGF